MKRSELNRGTGRLDYKSPERLRWEAEQNLTQRREAWRAYHPICWFCPMPSQCVHEIGTEGNRRAFVDQPCSWASTCSNCNQFVLTNYALWPPLRQMAVKLIHDPENVDLETYNRLRHRGPRAITMAELLLVKSTLEADGWGL